MNNYFFRYEFLKTRIFSIIAVTFTACHEVSIEGSWVEPVPGMNNMFQGFKLEPGGEASSINMATFQYKTWKKEGDRLILIDKSMGNHQTISFSDTLIIERLSGHSLQLKKRRGYPFIFKDGTETDRKSDIGAGTFNYRS